MTGKSVKGKKTSKGKGKGLAEEMLDEAAEEIEGLSQAVETEAAGSLLLKSQQKKMMSLLERNQRKLRQWHRHNPALILLLPTERSSKNKHCVKRTNS